MAGLYPPASAPVTQAMEQPSWHRPIRGFPKAHLYQKDTLAKYLDPSCSAQATLERETNIQANALSQGELWQNKIGEQGEHRDWGD